MANRAVGLMPKKEFVRRLSNELDVTQSLALMIIEAVETVILEGLHDYNKVKFGDLVTFTRQEIPSRPYKLPGDDTEYICEAYTKLVADMVESNRRLISKEEDSK